MPATDRPLKVIQRTTGNIGGRSLHAILGRDDMELVGVYAHGADKVGRDAAELAGRPEPTGIFATDGVDALLALGADACCWTESGFIGLGMIYTAMPATNAVPAVVAARPGIVPLADLPPVTGRFLG